MNDPGTSYLRYLGQAEGLLQSTFRCSSFYPKAVPADFAAREGQKGVKLASLWWGHPSGSEGRCALIYSERIEIINLMIFVSEAERIPLFASEIILMGGKVNVAVVDWQMAGGPEAMSEGERSFLQELHRRWSKGLTHGGAFPEWATAHFTPYCIYARPDRADQNEAVQAAFVGFLSAWFERVAPRLSDRSGTTDEQAVLSHYLDHHVEHTPGRPFLSKVFGSGWAESYFRQFMYAPLGRVRGFNQGKEVGAGCLQGPVCVPAVLRDS